MKLFLVTSANVGEIDDARINIVHAIYVFQRAIIFKIFFIVSLLRCYTILYVIQVLEKRKKLIKVYTCKQFTRRNYVIVRYIYDSLDTFACTAVLKYSDISRFMAKLVAVDPIYRGEMSDTIQLFRHLGKPLIFQAYQ